MAGNTIRTITITLLEATLVGQFVTLLGILTYNKIQESKKKKAEKKSKRRMDGLHQNSRS